MFFVSFRRKNKIWEDLTMKRKPKMHHEDDFDLDNEYNEDDHINNQTDGHSSSV